MVTRERRTHPKEQINTLLSFLSFTHLSVVGESQEVVGLGFPEKFRAGLPVLPLHVQVGESLVSDKTSWAALFRLAWLFYLWLMGFHRGLCACVRVLINIW